MNDTLKKVVFFVLLLSISYAAYNYMIGPANVSLAQKKLKVADDVAQLNRLAEFQEKIASGDIDRQLCQLQETIDFFEGRLPCKSDIAKVLEQVTIIAQKQGLKPKTIRTLKTKDNSGYIEQPLKMELVGNFYSFYSFLIELEQLPRIIKIRELDLRGETDEDGSVMADFVVSIFFQNKVG